MTELSEFRSEILQLVDKNIGRRIDSLTATVQELAGDTRKYFEQTIELRTRLGGAESGISQLTKTVYFGNGQPSVQAQLAEIWKEISAIKGMCQAHKDDSQEEKAVLIQQLNKAEENEIRVVEKQGMIEIKRWKMVLGAILGFLITILGWVFARNEQAKVSQLEKATRPAAEQVDRAAPPATGHPR